MSIINDLTDEIAKTQYLRNKAEKDGDTDLAEQLFQDELNLIDRSNRIREAAEWLT